MAADGSPRAVYSLEYDVSTDSRPSPTPRGVLARLGLSSQVVPVGEQPAQTDTQVIIEVSQPSARGDSAPGTIDAVAVAGSNKVAKASLVEPPAGLIKAHPDGRLALGPPTRAIQQGILSRAPTMRRPMRKSVSSNTGSDAVRRASSMSLPEFEPAPRFPWRKRLAEVLDSVPFTLLSVAVTLGVLYADDLRMAVFPPGADPHFLGFTIFCIVYFSLELLASSLAKPKYFLRFFCFIDLVATVSIAMDIPAFMRLLTGVGDSSSVTIQQQAQFSQAGRAAMVGARAARMGQILQVIRLLKYYRTYAKQKQQPQLGEEAEGFAIMGEGLDEGRGRGGKKRTRVGEKLSERTIKKVVLGVLFILFILPIFDSNVGYYGYQPTFDENGLLMLDLMYRTEGNSTAFQQAVELYMSDTTYELGINPTSSIYRLVVCNQTVYDDPLEHKRRESEIIFYSLPSPGCGNSMSSNGSSPDAGQCCVTEAGFDAKWHTRMQAILNVCRTTFIMLLLVVGALLIIRDAERLVLRPVERMMKKVKDMGENPLCRITTKSPADRTDKEQLETRILENAFTKVLSLLSVGFGEAGAEIISDNIKSGGDLNPMIPGRRTTAVFGFCDIRNFTDTTEVLQEQIMEFVNNIARIVHQEVALHGGSANKNIGDAFLTVWKLPGSAGFNRSSVVGRLPLVSGTSSFGSVSSVQSEEARALIADAALASFIIIQAAIKRSRTLQDYCSRADLNARMPGFQIKMGFGLHVGWAIEGAIGSEYKIDASYLSPHVNMASRLEAATKQYGVSLLLSEDFVRLLSPGVRRHARQVDCVTVKGSRTPVGLYTYDSCTEGLEALADLKTPTHNSQAGGGDGRSPKPPSARSDTYSLAQYQDEYAEHPDIVMTTCVDGAFLAQFAKGFEAYRAGDWQTAASILQQCRSARRGRRGEPVEDGPSATLLAFMEEHGLQAPPSWRGYRELTEK